MFETLTYDTNLGSDIKFGQSRKVSVFSVVSNMIRSSVLSPGTISTRTFYVRNQDVSDSRSCTSNSQSRLSLVLSINRLDLISLP